MGFLKDMSDSAVNFQSTEFCSFALEKGDYLFTAYSIGLGSSVLLSLLLIYQSVDLFISEFHVGPDFVLKNGERDVRGDAAGFEDNGSAVYIDTSERQMTVF